MEQETKDYQNTVMICLGLLFVATSLIYAFVLNLTGTVLLAYIGIDLLFTFLLYYVFTRRRTTSVICLS